MNHKMVDRVAALSFLLLAVNPGIWISQSQRSCTVDNKVVAHDDVYNLKGCLKLICKDGYLRQDAEECLWKDKCYEVGTRWVDGCDSYQCYKVSFRGGTAYPATYKGTACKRYDRCYAIGSSWREGCDTWRCKDKGEGVEPEVFLENLACSDNGKCISVGDVFKRHGNWYRCVLFPVMDLKKKMTKKVTPRTCIMFRRSFPHGTIFTRKCTMLKCWDGTVQQSIMGCLIRDVCYKENTTWKTNCTTFKCVKKTGKGEVGFEPQFVKAQCKFNWRLCVDLGRQWSSLCETFTCVKNPNGAGVSVDVKQREGCRFQGQCYREWQKWSGKCKNYACLKQNEKYIVDVEYTGCEFQGQCYKEGQTWTHKCTTWKCNKKTEGDSVYLYAGTDNMKCLMEPAQKCLSEGEEWRHNCSLYKCTTQVYGEYRKGVVVTTEPRCQRPDGKCAREGEIVYVQRQFAYVGCICRRVQDGTGRLTLDC